MWLHSDGTVIGENVEQETEEVENTKRVTSISTLTLTAKKADHNTTVTCQAQNLADRQPRSTSIHILVEYAPHVTIKADHDPVFETDTVTFNCDAHANPSTVTYRWFVDGQIVPGNHGTEHTITNVSREVHNKIVKCEVSNLIGKSEGTETLDIHYKPKFVRKPKDVSGEMGQEATLKCQVDGNPTPTYTWFRDGDYHTVHSYESELKVKIDERSVGRYVCRASVRGFPEVTTSSELFMKGPPRVIRQNQKQFGREGSNVEVTCNVFAIPPPGTIQWSLHGFSLDLASGRYRTVEKSRKDGMLSTLIILNSVPSDFGDYNCTVRNSHGDDSMVITLTKEKSLPLIIILSAVIGGIVLTVAAILVMIFCRRSSALSLKAVGNISAPSTIDEKTRGANSVVTSSSDTTPSSKEVTGKAKQHYLVDDGGWKHGFHKGEERDGDPLWATSESTDDPLLPGGRNFEFPSRLADVSAGIGGFGSYGGYPMGYDQRPPPPHPNHRSAVGGGGGVGFNDSRYHSKYPTPYYGGDGGLSKSPMQSPQRLLPGSRAYATLSNRNDRSYSPVGWDLRVAALNGNSYVTAGRRAKNGGGSGGLASVAGTIGDKNKPNPFVNVMAPNGDGASQQKQYILPPDSDLDSTGSATRV